MQNTLAWKNCDSTAYLLVGQLATPFLIIGLRVFTKITNRERVRVLVINENNQVLLLKDVYSDRKWTLPGGGINRNETAVSAARRELHEETGIIAPEAAFIYIRTLAKPDVNIPFRAPLYHVKVQKSVLPGKLANPHEIADIVWFDRHSLPSPLSNVARHVLIEKND